MLMATYKSFFPLSKFCEAKIKTRQDKRHREEVRLRLRIFQRLLMARPVLGLAAILARSSYLCFPIGSSIAALLSTWLLTSWIQQYSRVFNYSKCLQTVRRYSNFMLKSFFQHPTTLNSCSTVIWPAVLTAPSVSLSYWLL